MKIALVLDSYTLRIKDTLQYTGENYVLNADYTGKSQITVDHEPDIADNDFILCKEDGAVVFTGICEDASLTGKSTTYTIKMVQKECFFDREIFVKDEELMATGLEDFVAQAIADNWTASGDALMDYTNITVVCDTHTPCAASVATTVDTQGGAYNLRTFLGNCLEQYRLMLRFDFSDGALEIHIYTDAAATIDVDVTVTDVSDYVETYSVAVLARLLVRWKIPDGRDDDGNDVIGAEVDRAFYLKTDRSVTQDKTDPDRADGISRSVRIEAETEEEMIQAALNEFASNSYQHKVEFAIRKASRLYPLADLYLGRPCRFKTKRGIKTSIITGIKASASSTVAALTFGTLKITLIEKVRGRL